MKGSKKHIKIDNEKSLPLISIITVVYNAEENIEKTILSVLNQSYNNIEYIIIDGASSDGTLDIIKKYSDKLGYWISESDNGVYDAMNKGINAASGNWVYFLGAGDTILNVLDELSVNFTDSNSIYYGNVYKKDTAEIYDGAFSPFKLAVKNICHQAIFYPISALHEYKYDLTYKIQADHHLNMRLYGDENFRFKYLPILIANYDGGGYSALNIDKAFFKDKLSIIRSNFPYPVFLYVYLRKLIAKTVKTNYQG